MTTSPPFARRAALFTACLALAALPALAAGGVDPDLLAGLAARSIGPATMSGRVADVEVVPGAAGKADRVWVGAATGGVWRSDDGGLTWTPVFDDQPVAAIGAVAVSAVNPERVWVGTGEGNPRNSASVGNGVYRSDDGGESWVHLGLDSSERIHRIALHPTDPDVAWVCALGPSWGDGGERGVYKTSDAGATWKRVLAGPNPTTGCADLELDPSNPAKLVAAMWDHRRWPWSFRSGGPGSGLHVSWDGGESWRRATPEDGLPEGDLGRIGLAMAPSRPEVVYALVEAKENALYRSDDGGRSWRQLTSDSEIGNRPFYYADLRVDPLDPNHVYSLWGRISVSTDGGRTFQVLVPFNRAHPDHHAMWIDPREPSHLWIGNDGGVYESHDHGGSWRFVPNLPLAQLYHVRAGDGLPYDVYFGLQDNGSWAGPSTVWENGGIRNHHWQEVHFGDGFDTAPVPGDERYGYSSSQEGYLVRWDRETGERKSIRPATGPGEETLRFNWNAALAVDPFDADTVYVGSQYVHRSRDRGDTWETISPDLTSDNPEWQRQAESGGLTLDVTGAENFTTLVALAPSPLEEGVLWAGSDDGRLHLTRDGGATWARLDGNVPGVPADTWIPHVAPSPHDPATAFVVFDDHRRSNWTPYVYRTTDYGATWTRLADGDDVRGYALSIVQDPVDPDLLFLGTEFGLWTSLDGGGSWLPWKHGVPTASAMDLAIQPREGDLVVGTHGRGVFIVDDVSPLRGLTAETLAEPLHLFPPAPAQQHRVQQSGSSRFPGQGEFRADSEPYGAAIAFSLAGDDLPHPDEMKERERKQAEREAKRRAAEEAAAAVSEAGEEAAPAGAEAEEEEEEEEEEEPEAAGDRRGRRGRGGDGPQAKFEIRDAGGELVRSFERPVHRGVNRVSWDLRRDAYDEPSRGDEERWWDQGGPEVLPGEYTVTVRFRDQEASAPVTVLADPRFDRSPEDRRAKAELLARAGAVQEALAAAIERVRRTRGEIETALELHARRQKEHDDEAGGGDEKKPDPLAKAGRKLVSGLDELEAKLWSPPGAKGIEKDDHPWDDVIRSWMADSSWDAPTATDRRYLEIAESAAAAALEEVNAFFADRVAPFRQQVRDAELVLLPEAEPLEMP